MTYIWKRYWRFTVIDERRVVASGKNRTQVDLQCSCGKIRTMLTNNISTSNLNICVCTIDQPEDNIWNTYNKLKIISIFRKKCATRNQQEIRAKCLCECGVEKDIRYDRVMSWWTKSCGCIELKRSTLWLWRKRPYRIRNAMMSSCYKEWSMNYARRGAVGIKVQDSRKYFNKWWEDNKDKYSEFVYFTRIDPFKDFTSENCVRYKAYNVSRFDVYFNQ